jgi:hypothetical protein
MPINSYDHRGPANDNLLDGVAQNMATYLGQAPVAGAAAGAIRRAMTAATAAINTAETVLINVPLVIPSTYLNNTLLGTLNVGSLIRATVIGTCTSSNADVSTFTLRMGTAGTTSDASIATWVVTSSGGGTNQPFRVVIEITIRTLGSSGTGYGLMTVTSTGAATGVSTGIQAFPVTNVNSAAALSAVPTTTATYLDITYVSAASTTTCTFQEAYVEIFP